MMLMAFALVGSVVSSQPVSSPPVAVSKDVEKALSRADGESDRTAYKVKSVEEEYEILAALGLRPGSQSLVVGKKPYDVIQASDPRTGATRQVWFDISSFYPEL